MKNESSPGSSTKALWMVVDDDEGMRDFLTALLEMTGRIQVESFPSALEALPALAAAMEEYEFIITDFEMPGMNGVEFCNRVHALKPAMKILLVSGGGMINEADARQWGFCGFVKKPFAASTFHEALEAAH